MAAKLALDISCCWWQPPIVSEPFHWRGLVKGSRDHSSSHKQKALLDYVHSLIPPEARVTVVGDSEFGRVGVQKLLKRWGWHYVLRQIGFKIPFIRMPHRCRKPGANRKRRWTILRVPIKIITRRGRPCVCPSPRTIREGSHKREGREGSHKRKGNHEGCPYWVRVDATNPTASIKA